MDVRNGWRPVVLAGMIALAGCVVAPGYVEASGPAVVTVPGPPPPPLAWSGSAEIGSGGTAGYGGPGAGFIRPGRVSAGRPDTGGIGKGAGSGVQGDGADAAHRFVLGGYAGSPCGRRFGHYQRGEGAGHVSRDPAVGEADSFPGESSPLCRVMGFGSSVSSLLLEGSPASPDRPGRRIARCGGGNLCFKALGDLIEMAGRP